MEATTTEINTQRLRELADSVSLAHPQNSELWSAAHLRRSDIVEAGWANPSDRLRTYVVDMKCGHVEMRKMRPSTARAVSTPDGLIHSDNLCASCSATRDAIAIPALVKRMGWNEVGVTGECRADDYDHGAEG